MTAEVPPPQEPTAAVLPPPAPHNSATVVPSIQAATEEVVPSEAVPLQQLETHPEPVASPHLGSLEKEVPEQNNTSTATFIALEASLQADDVA
jgi:hypothetical protein